MAVPPGVVTLTLPLESTGTWAMILVADCTENDCAGTPPKRTAVAPVKLLPVMVTLAPKAADTGAKAVMAGVAGGGGGAGGVGAGLTAIESSVPVSFEQEMVMTDIISGNSQVIFFITVVLCVLNEC